MIHWDDLKIFLAVARRKKLTLAARELHMDETTVSRRLKRLEDALGQTLFERMRSGHEITTHGQTLLVKAEEMERQADAISVRQGGSAQKPSGSLRISTAEGFGAYVLTPLLGEFRDQYPDIEIDLVSGSGFLSLSRREADVAIGLSRSRSKQIISEVLYPYHLYIYGNGTQTDIKSINDLKKHTLIDYIDDLLYSEELRYSVEHLPTLSPKIRSTSIIAQKRLVETGAGIAILPEFMADNKIIQLLPDKIKIRRQFWFSTHQSLASLGKVRAFKDFVTKRLSGTALPV